MDLFRALKSSRLGGGTKKFTLVLEKWGLERVWKRFLKTLKTWKRFKNTKIEHKFNQISLTSAIIIRKFWSYRYLVILSNYESGAEIIAFLLFGKYLADVSKIGNCDVP